MDAGDEGRPTRTLVVTRNLPSPPRSGGDLRRLHLIGALAELGPTCVFGLAAAGDAPQFGLAGWTATSDPRAARTPEGPELVEALRAGRSPFATVESAVAAAELAAVVEEFAPDVTVVAGLELSGYLDRLRPRVERLVLDLDYAQAYALADMAKADPNRRRALLWQHASSLVGEEEHRALRLVDQVWVSAAEDLERSGAGDVGVDVAVVPNVIDVPSYPHADRPDPRSLVFTARFDFWPNEHAARLLTAEIVPALRDVSLALVGLAPPPWLRDLDDPRVTVTGAVPDVRPYLASASVMPVPLVAGSGTRLKVLEAFAAGVPVVSTAKGVEGLGLVDQQHYLRAEDAGAFVDEIEQLLDDGTAARHLAAAASELVHSRFSLDALRVAVAGALERRATGLRGD